MQLGAEALIHYIMKTVNRECKSPSYHNNLLDDLTI